MNYEDYIADALDMVSAWDLPESEFTDAVNAQAQLMAGMQLEVFRFTDDLPNAYTPLQF